MQRDSFSDANLKALLAELARESLTAQHEVLRELRAGAGMLLAATSLIASFLGSQALDQGGITFVSVLALGTFAVALLATLFVLLPRPQIRSDVPAHRVIALVRDTGRDPYDALAELAEDTRRINGPIVRAARLGYNVALGLVCAQVCFWIVHLLATM